MARLLEVHARLEPLAAAGATAPGAPAGTAVQPGDLVRLVVSVAGDGEGRLAVPPAEALGETLGPGVRAVAGPELGEARPADVPGLPAGAAWRREASWTVQVLLPPGEHELGPVPVKLVDDGSREVLDSAEAPGVSLAVRSVLDEAMASQLDEAAGTPELAELAAAQRAPVRGPWELVARPVVPPWLTWLLLALALALLALALWRWWRRRRAARPVRAVPLEAPEVEARRRLESLPALLDRGEVRAFHVELADVLKRYLSRRWEADLLERTTDEVRALLPGPLRERTGAHAFRQRIVDVLVACDLVKFAKDVPARAEALALLEDVRTIVEKTTPVAPAATEEAA